MEFTKEQIEYLRKDFAEMSGKSMKEWFDSLLKPETKKIIVEIEYEGDVSKETILGSFIWQEGKFKVTELPKVFALKDLRECAEYFISRVKQGAYYNYNLLGYDDIIEWLSERDNNLNKK